MTRNVPRSTVCQLVAKYIAAWNAHDVGRVISLFAEHASYGEFGQGKVMLGREEIRRYLTAMFRTVPDLATTPTGHPICSRERVLYKWIMTGTPQGQFAGVPPTGNRFEVRGATALLTTGAKILRAAHYFDVRSVVGHLWPAGERRSDTATASPDISASDLMRRRALLDDEDNIGYGE